MTENDKQIERLILKQISQEALTVEEQVILDQWREQSPENEALLNKFGDKEWVRENLDVFNRAPSDRIWAGIVQKLKNDHRNKRRQAEHILKTAWYRPAAAAAIAAAIFFLALRLLYPSSSQPASGGIGARAQVNGEELASLKSLPAYTSSAFAGDHPELLTLADGRAIDIVRARAEVVAAFMNTPTAYQVFSTGQHVPSRAQVLPDGSKVWLSYASSLCCPKSFTGGRRLVRLSGEAFFEVAKDASKPFIVETEIGTTQDRGTKFNIKAYPGDPDGRVTLLEGAVTVKKDGDAMDLDGPLEQAQLNADGRLQRRKLTNADDAMAWRKGQFHFADTDFRMAMREVARWYHKSVTFTDEEQGEPINADLGRELSWDKTLDAMKNLEIGFVRITVAGDSVSIASARTGNLK